MRELPLMLKMVLRLLFPALRFQVTKLNFLYLKMRRVECLSQAKLLPIGKKIAAGTTTNADGGNALRMANLQNELAFNSVTWSSGSGSFTFDEYYNAVVSTIGIESFSAQAILRQQEGVMLQLNSRRESISGVSIDEEMIKMIKFQQAYNASARMISMVDEMLDTLNRI